MPNPTGPILYKVLAHTTHCEYNAPLWRKVSLLAEAGYALKARASEIIERHPSEKLASYMFRLKAVAPMAYFGMLLEYLIGALFKEGLEVVEADASGATKADAFYSEFQSNANRRGDGFQAVLREAIRSALLHRRGWVQVDMPPPVAAANRAEEEAQGGGKPYAFAVPCEAILDWGEADGKIAWLVKCVTRQERPSPFEPLPEKHDEFTVWTIENGKAYFRRYRSEPYKGDEPPSENSELRLVNEGTTTFEAIPFVYLELPPGMWMGNKVGPLAEEHYNRRSDLVGAMGPSLRELPYIKRGPEIPQIGGGISATQTDPSRGEDAMQEGSSGGVVQIGYQDELGFAGPSGVAFELAAKQLDDLKREIFGVVHAMSLAAPDTAAVRAASAKSKREDHKATQIVLAALGEKARKLAVDVYTLVTDARDEDYTWTAVGLEEFDIVDTEAMLKEAETLEVVDIPSETFHVEHLTRLALNVVSHVDSATKQQIAKELKTGVKEKLRQKKELERAAHKLSDDDEGAAGGGRGTGEDEEEAPGG